MSSDDLTYGDMHRRHDRMPTPVHITRHLYFKRPWLKGALSSSTSSFKSVGLTVGLTGRVLNVHGTFGSFYFWLWAGPGAGARP